MKKSLRITSFIFLAVIMTLLGTRLLLLKKSPRVSTTSYGHVADFQLIDQSGKSFGKKDLVGYVWVADFMFTRCMGPCPLLTTKMAQLENQFSNKEKLQFVSFSVDPEFDTPPVLKKYAATYGAQENRWTFLTGSKQKIFDLIRTSFHLAVEPTPGQTPAITDILHSLHFVLVDKDGAILGYFNTTDQQAMISLQEQLKKL